MASGFKDVAAQNLARSPLRDGERVALCVQGLLAVAKRTADGGSAWHNFDRAAKARGSTGEAELAAAGVELLLVCIEGFHKRRRAVRPEHVPAFLAVTCGRAAEVHLKGSDLEETLAVRGVQEARQLLDEQLQKLAAKPEDIAAVQKVAALFEGDTSRLRYRRVGERNIMVFAAINLVMMAKGCGYTTAQTIVWKIFKDYFQMNLVDANGTTVNIYGTAITTYKIQFCGQGQRETLALDVQGSTELLCLIPGSDFSAAQRRRAGDLMLRIDGGDESLIDRIQANRKFQDYLATHDPDHPFRAVGEYAERRQAEEAVPEEQRRAEMELALQHKKRLFELEYETAQKKARLETDRMEQENAKLVEEVNVAKQHTEVAKAAAETSIQKSKAEREQLLNGVHESFRRERASTITANMQALRVLRGDQTPLSPRSLRVVEDELRTGLLGRERPDAELGAPVYLTAFLQKELQLKEGAAIARAKVFGNDALAAVRAAHPDYDAAARTNRSVDGRDRASHLYFEAHLPAIRSALPRYLDRAAPVRDDELTAAGLQARRAVAQPSVRAFFGHA